MIAFKNEPKEAEKVPFLDVLIHESCHAYLKNG